MAKDFIDVAQSEEHVFAPVTQRAPQDNKVAQFLKLLDEKNARRAAKATGGVTMALTLAACSTTTPEVIAPVVPVAPVAPVDPTPVPPANTTITLDSTATVVLDPLVVEADLIIEVPSITPGADTQTLTVNATGTGTSAVTFNFADADDTVILSATSSFTGFTIINIVAGTVNVSAADIGGATVVNVASGVVMTAAQFLALTTVNGASVDAELTIIISTAAEAALVLAAIGTLAGTFATSADAVTLVASADSTLTPAQVTLLNADLDAALDAAATAAALPAAVAQKQAADAALSTFLQDTVAENSDVATLLGGPGPFLDAGIRLELAAALGNATTSLDAATPTAPITTAGLSAAQIAANTAAARASLAADIAVAETAVTAARQAVLNDSDLGAGFVNLVDTSVAAAAAQTAAGVANTAAFTALGTATAEIPSAVSGSLMTTGITVTVGGVPIVVAGIAFGNVVTLTSSVTLAGGVYTVSDGALPAATVTIPQADFDAMIAAAQAAANTSAALDAATTAFTTASGALVVASAPLSPSDADLVADYQTALTTLATERADAAAFEAALASFNTLNGLNTQLDVLDAAVIAANDALFSVADGLGLGTGGTAGSDLVFVEVGGVIPVAIDIAGTDFIAITGGVGTFTFVTLGATDLITTAQGSATVLEIFAKQNGANVDLFIENIATAGSGTSATVDFTTVTLNGVELADLSFNADAGILTAVNI